MARQANANESDAVVMAGVSVKIIKNRCPQVAARFPRETSQIVREQVLESEARVKTNVVSMDVIDTGNLLGSVQGEMTGEFSGLVSVGAEYAIFQDKGTRYISPRPFFTDETHRAEGTFPDRFKGLEARLG
jgi:hypothetical protein